MCCCGYHEYKDVWGLYLGDSFTMKHERINQHDNNVMLAITHTFTRQVHECSNYLDAVQSDLKAQRRVVLERKQIRIALRVLKLGRYPY